VSPHIFVQNQYTQKDIGKPGRSRSWSGSWKNRTA